MNEPKFIKNYLFFLLILISLGLITGCGKTEKTELAPADEVSETEVLQVKDVMVEVSSDKWDGDPNLKTQVTPLHFTITNNSKKSISIRYDDFALISGEGDYYSALPVYKLKGEANNTALNDDYDILNKPEIQVHGYYVYPTYSPIYPGMPTTEYPYYSNPEFYQRYYDWESIGAGLPTVEMRSKALPEGVLEPGGTLSGFIYFEKVSPDNDIVKLRTDLINAETGKKFGTVSIPFYVMKEK